MLSLCNLLLLIADHGPAEVGVGVGVGGGAAGGGRGRGAHVAARSQGHQTTPDRGHTQVWQHSDYLSAEPSIFPKLHL